MYARDISEDASTRLIEDGSGILVYRSNYTSSKYYKPFPIISFPLRSDIFDYGDDNMLKTKPLDPDFSTNSHLLGNADVKCTVPQMSILINSLRVRAELSVKSHIVVWLGGTNDYIILNATVGHQEEAEVIIFVISNCELLRLLKGNLDSITSAIEAAEIITESCQISPRELVEAITKATQPQHQIVQQQIEKIERIEQVMEEEGASILKTKREAEDEKQEEICLLLMLLVLWFLLCYCSDSTVWCVDVDVSFGLSLALSEIVLLLGGDIEKNPGPLTGMYRL
jgi:hypothetical protein